MASEKNGTEGGSGATERQKEQSGAVKNKEIDFRDTSPNQRVKLCTREKPQVRKNSHFMRCHTQKKRISNVGKLTKKKKHKHARIHGGPHPAHRTAATILDCGASSTERATPGRAVGVSRFAILLRTSTPQIRRVSKKSRRSLQFQ